MVLKSRNENAVTKGRQYHWWGGVCNAWKLRDIFMHGNDAYMFMDLNASLSHGNPNLDVRDFHRFEAVFHRLMGW